MTFMGATCSRRLTCGLLALAAAGLLSPGKPLADDGVVRIGDRELSAVAIGRQVAGLVEADWIDQDEAFRAEAAQPPTPTPASVVALGVLTWQDAAGGCDGVKTGRCGFHTASNETDPWWQVDLGRPCLLDRVVVFNRTDGATAARTRNLRVLVADRVEEPEFVEVYRHNGETFYGVREQRPLTVDFRARGVTARVVRVAVLGRCSLALDEVEVYEQEKPDVNLALGKPADQKSVGTASRAEPGAKPWGSRPEPLEATAPPETEAFSLAHTRAVIGRAEALAARFGRFGGASARLAQLRDQLRQADERRAKFAQAGAVAEEVRRQLYLDARRILRQIAFCHPLLDFDKLLFIKRHDPGGLYHMVHQFYGFGAKSGGGLFVLCDPFSDEPKLVDVLQQAVIQDGRLAGSRLEPGSFLSPDLSFDGRTILFAYTEGRAEGIEWSPRASYHIFRVGVDGTRLTQLTDGAWNEFDPCWLPNGRIAFISERRGGYLRCGGSAPPYDSPTYTLYSMVADGSGMTCLSFHETQEWQPSVDHNGMIVYTRWDYVDRDTNVAHHVWSCFPDGRDPRSYHGNYPVKRETRPWMEMDVRAVPGSNKYVATAAAHHGHAFGSLVLIDYRPLDDGAMSQVERLTPDVPLPESEGGKKTIRQHMAYGTAWPLSEEDYLCVYDRRAANRGIYWIDRSGNRELLYRDPEISCLSPIPLRSRPCPPAVPDRTGQTADSPNVPTGEALGTIAVTNVYDSDFHWPEGTEVAALRVIQVLPKTTPPVDQPRIGAATETNARAVLGTVPVEPDGSAYFEAPVGKLIYFQALDRRGLAVQSMRSGTYVHPGETLVCQGCHEPKHRPPAANRGIALALQRPPSKLQPELDGSNPFNYPRLVQGVLDRHCVECHRQRKAIDLSGAPGAKHGWTRSYENLAPKYGFYFTVSNGTINSGVHGGSRTTPGRFGARAAPLLPYLDERHYGVRLSDDDFHRLTLWLDCNSEFYGAYHDPLAQARGSVVTPQLD